MSSQKMTQNIVQSTKTLTEVPTSHIISSKVQLKDQRNELPFLIPFYLLKMLFSNAIVLLPIFLLLQK